MSRIYLESGIEDLSKWLSDTDPKRLDDDHLYELGSENCPNGKCLAMLPYEVGFIPSSYEDNESGTVEVPFGIISSEQRSKWAAEVGAQNDNKIVFIVNTDDGLVAIAIWDFSVRIGPLHAVIIRG